MKKLSDLNVGDKGVLLEVTDDHLQQQLLEMGVTPGQTIEVERKSPFSDPIAVVVSHLLLSIRISDANYIILTVKDE
jgi:ferrous iron transport protein A